jgi:hypothetical protein
MRKKIGKKIWEDFFGKKVGFFWKIFGKKVGFFWKKIPDFFMIRIKTEIWSVV